MHGTCIKIKYINILEFTEVSGTMFQDFLVLLMKMNVMSCWLAFISVQITTSIFRVVQEESKRHVEAAKMSVMITNQHHITSQKTISPYLNLSEMFPCCLQQITTLRVLACTSQHKHIFITCRSFACKILVGVQQISPEKFFLIAWQHAK